MEGVYAVGGLVMLCALALFVVGAFRFVFSGAEPDTCPYDKPEGERGISGQQWAEKWQADQVYDISDHPARPSVMPRELRRIPPSESHRPRAVPRAEPGIHWSKPADPPPAPIEVEHSDDGLVRGFFARLFSQDQDRDQ